MPGVVLFKAEEVASLFLGKGLFTTVSSSSDEDDDEEDGSLSIRSASLILPRTSMRKWVHSIAALLLLLLGTHLHVTGREVSKSAAVVVDGASDQLRHQL